MFYHVMLGLLRDGERRHGYQLVVRYRRETGVTVSPGNVYRELARLVSQGMVETVRRPADADPRRVPYRITGRGREHFDRWLSSPPTRDDEFSDWLLFVDHVPRDVRERILERRREDIWMRSRLLARRHEDAGGAAGPVAASMLAALEARRLRAELEFLAELPALLVRAPGSSPAIPPSHGAVHDAAPPLDAGVPPAG
jgi:DNA-binding PadR family transcriptional regulator